MENFTFNNPTKILFGKGREAEVGREASAYGKNILLHYGGGSIKKSGLYDRVVASLKEAGLAVVELSGVKPNPRLSLVREGIRICEEQKIDLILAVGGGSVIDSAKAIAAGHYYEGDVWDLYTGKGNAEKALPVATILTIPAAGSESSTGSVITNEDGDYKRPFDHEILYPVFSILNPELAFTLPDFQVACGIADMTAHLLERYFTNAKPVGLTDRLIEGALKNIMEYAPVVLADRENYDGWAEIMWSGTVAHNNSLNTGRIGDWASHDIEHELSGIYDIAHGAGLAVIFPAWMKYNYKHDINLFLQWAVRVMNVEQKFRSDEETVLSGIEAFEDFLKSIGLAVRLDGVGIDDTRLEEMADKATNGDKRTVGNFVKLNKADVFNILKLAL
ncbi:MAG: iron-containing alcohol dehydrogenase [Spirochaetales bacterium]|nr:iron-containing alcohol dehydrogenase [Spirochaetales bacterium]